MIMYVYLLIPFIIMISKAKVYKQNERNTEILPLDSSMSIRGIMAILIILHHLSLVESLSNYLALSMLNSTKAGFFIAFFFFCSGYGLLRSTKNKKNYFQGFLKRRLTSVLLPFYLINIIYTIYYAIGNSIFNKMVLLGKIKEIISYILGFKLINENAWFIITIVMFYVAFWATYGVYRGSDRFRCVLMLIYTIIYITICILQRHGKGWFQGEWWYDACAFFLIGIIVAQNKDRLLACLYYYYYYILLSTCMLFGLSYFVLHKVFISFTYWCENKPGITGREIVLERSLCLLCQSVCIFFFIALSVIIMAKCKFSNRILRILGSVSLEIYLIHNLFIILLRSQFIYISNDYTYVGMVITVSIAASCILCAINQRIEKVILIRKKNNAEYLS